MSNAAPDTGLTTIAEKDLEKHRATAQSMVTRVIVVDGGKIVADGPRDRIMEALASGRIARAA